MAAVRHMTLAAVVVVCSIAPLAFGDFTADFEAPDYNGSAAGTLLTGQQGWYLPSGDDYNLYTYADNPFGMTAVNPTGGDQFAAGLPPGVGTTHGRGQHDETLTAGSRVLYGYDFNGKSLLADPSLAASNVGSFSVQPSGESYIALMIWNSPADTYRFEYIVDDVLGEGISPNPVVSSALEPDHWYRAEAIVDYDLNRVIQSTLIDLETLEETTIMPEDWFLRDQPSAGELSTGFRMFNFWAAEQSNMLAFDNVVVQSIPIPEPSTFCLLGAGAMFVILTLRRRRTA